MAIQLSKFVGRDALPTDKPAFVRLNRLFAEAAAQAQGVPKKPANKRRKRVANPQERTAKAA